MKPSRFSLFGAARGVSASSGLRAVPMVAGDAALLLGLISIIALMVLPMPPALLDALIAVNITASVALLMLALYVRSPLALSTFPSLLLFTTLLRLSLNIASTKQILLHANAGHIIDTFGKLVVGGNVVVGLVVFVIIATVQFVVVAKGSERVAEVGARFTLDGMPGKQMSIDADLRAGLMTKEEARRRRRQLEEESQFHGAMDGAMKFVKGDAIAGLIIAFINIVAGIAVGAGMRGLSMGEALQRYTVLTVGDGMVSQVPSLFVSIAAGVLITRVGGDDEKHGQLAKQIGSQVVEQPIALALTACVLFGFLLVPGFPALQFALLAAIMGGAAWFILRKQREQRSHQNAPMPAMRRDGAHKVPTLVHEASARSAAPLSVRVASDWTDYVDATRLNEEIERAAVRIRREVGIPFPGIAIERDARLPKGTYVIEVHELPKSRGVLHRGLFFEGGGVASVAAESIEAPAFGPFAAGRWAVGAPRSEDNVDETPADPKKTGRSAEVVFVEHLDAVIRKEPDLFIGIQEAQYLIDQVGESMPELAQEVLRNVALQRVSDVLRRLVQEQVSIRQIREILESLIVWGPREKDPVVLTECVRIDLGRYTAHRVIGNRAVLPVMILAAGTEDVIRKAVQSTSVGGYVALSPEDTQRLIRGVKHALAKSQTDESGAVLATSMDVRRYVRRLIESDVPRLTVLSYQELGSHVPLKAIGQVEFDSA